MKVLYGITVGGSADSLLRGQLRWQRERGWDVVLVTNPDPQAAAASRREGVALHGIPMERSISPARDLAALVQWLRAVREEAPDVVNASTPKAGLLGMLSAWLLRVPRRVYVVRGLRVEGTRGVLSWLLWTMEWLTMWTATDVIFVSESLASAAYSRHLGRRTRSWLIGAGSSNGVDAVAVASRADANDSTTMRNKLGLPPEKLVAGFIGRITFDKGIGTILGAASDPDLDPRWHFLAVGGVEDDALAARLDGAGRVTRLDHVDDVWSLFPAMDVLVLPTLREGFPNVVLEAAAARTPALTTRATGAVDSVIDGVTGRLFAFGDRGAFVSLLNELAEQPERLEAMGRAAERRAVDDFQPESIWDGVHQIMSGSTTSTSVHRLDGNASNGQVRTRRFGAAFRRSGLRGKVAG